MRGCIDPVFRIPRAIQQYVQRGAKRHCQRSSTANLIDFCKEDTKKIRRESLLRVESKDRTIINNSEKPFVKFADQLRRMVDFTSMDHLGLMESEEILNVYHRTMVEESLTNQYDYNMGLRMELESVISQFHQRPSCFFFSHVPDVKRILLRELNTSRDAIFYDKTSNNSDYIMSACMAETVAFDSMNPEDLQKKIFQHEYNRHKMIIVDTAYPLSGEMPPLRKIADVADENNCLLVVDDSYGFGILGKNLRGSEEMLPENRRPFLLTNSFHHTLALNDYGYVVGPKALIEHIAKLDVMQNYREIPSPVLGVTLKIFAMMKRPEMVTLSQSVQSMANFIRVNLSAAGYHVDSTSLPTVSIKVGKESLLDYCIDQLQDVGLLCTVSKFPDTPKGESRLCLGVTLDHTKEIVDLALQKIVIIGNRIKIPQNK